MKKVLLVLGVVMVSLMAAGCGNSADGDSGRLSFKSAPSL
ncbi:MAG: hypothetical protein RIQ52_1817 [Pseudomonadota bacterium]|jgi:outer membrane murein-binding lipoprotein Lpp